MDKQRGGAVTAFTLAINMIPEPVGVAVPTGSVSATRRTRDTLPSRRQRTSKDDYSPPKTSKVFVFGPAEDVAVGVASSADFTGDVAVGVASPDDFAGVVTVGVASSADIAGDITVSVTSSADLADPDLIASSLTDKTLTIVRDWVRDGMMSDPLWPAARYAWHVFNRTLLMMLAMFAGEHHNDWDVLLPAVMMAYRSSVHESTGFIPYRLMFGEECTIPMDVGLP